MFWYKHFNVSDVTKCTYTVFNMMNLGSVFILSHRISFANFAINFIVFS